VYWVIIVWLPRVIGTGASVNGSALVFCGRDVLFLGGRNADYTHTYGCRLQLELLWVGAIAPETCTAKYREE
jgi:hypothetical protein